MHDRGGSGLRCGAVSGALGVQAISPAPHLARPPCPRRVEHNGRDDRIAIEPDDMEGFFGPVLDGVVDLARWAGQAAGVGRELLTRS